MQIRVFLLAIMVGSGVASGSAAAAPADPQHPDPQQADASDAPAGRGRLGFAALQISPGLRTFLGAPSDRGVLVDRLRPDSPAARAGLRVGDVILDVDAAPARTVDDIIEAISDRKKGDVVAVQAERGRAAVSLQIKLDSDPGARVEEWGARLDRPGGRWRQLGEGEAPFDLNQLFGDAASHHELEAMRKQLQQLEQRIDKLEHH